VNERIRELAIDCATQLDWDLPSDPTNYTFSSTGLEKFAELIIEECAEIFEGLYTDQQRPERIDTRIKRHFGVG
jgi:hypothetical protein